MKTTIPARDLERLGAVVFVATRSLDEFASTQQRHDAVTIWGVGCHPGVVAAQNAFNAARFAGLVLTTPFVSEVGLDGRSKVPLDQQEATFRAVLHELTKIPRITSIHSSGAPRRVLEALSATPVRGVVLHWWRGTWAETARAVELGCWFSVNASGIKTPADVAHIPLDRVLTETDHPSGDRGTPEPRQPGSVQLVEQALAEIHGMTVADIRQQIWGNFSKLVADVGVEPLLPGPVQRMVAAVRNR
ncbi:TatD family hydrolase [Cryobacterium sp. Y29]|uniref:TatD family hydrolase n=1 Tax=Cryobacterium sp. Y29 TaxID=2048285 RepID=UPI0018EB61A0|nr:TatD family hydrolase [Cryobacterium sp. Y29]